MSQRCEGVFARPTSALLAIGLCLAMAASCARSETDGEVETKAIPIAAATPGTGPGDLDLLFMIDDSSGMTSMQTKLAAQIPSFIDALAILPSGLPNIHVAVVSSDLGAPTDQLSLTQCTSTGDQGLFRLSPSCASSTLVGGATYLSNVDGSANYTGNLADVLACIMPLGEQGCLFDHQLSSIARALGADGAPAPAQNAGFLRSGADLAIIILSNADDCSQGPRSDLYFLNSGHNNIANGLGPMARYRCNEFGHLCRDPSGDPQKLVQPPEAVPTDAQGTPSAPTLTLIDCESLDTEGLDTAGLLTPVSALVSGIRALKADPDHQIFLGAIVAPVTPYTVDWVPPVGGEDLRAGELWPQIEHSCGSGDGSFGDPAVRIDQLVRGFGANGVSTSICNPSYSSVLEGLAAKIGAHLQGAPGTTISSGAGGSGVVGLDGGGGATGATDAATGLADGGGNLPGTGGTNGPVPLPGAHPTANGLVDGGCDIGASGPGAAGLTLLIAFLLAGRRKLTGNLRQR